MSPRGELDRATIVALAAISGFLPATLEKVLRLGEMLADIGVHPFLASRLALKGGTAINLLHERPPRLSVDLDFNYVGALDREAMLAERPEVARALEAIATAHGYRVQRSRAEHGGGKLYLGYRATGGHPDRIEIDVNYLFRLPLAPLETQVLWQPGDLQRPRVRTVGRAELAAGKLWALLDRSHPRDLFDALRLPAILGSAGAPHHSDDYWWR